jgi:hypothetical protein
MPEEEVNADIHSKHHTQHTGLGSFHHSTFTCSKGKGKDVLHFHFQRQTFAIIGARLSLKG